MDLYLQYIEFQAAEKHVQLGFSVFVTDQARMCGELTIIYDHRALGNVSCSVNVMYYYS